VDEEPPVEGIARTGVFIAAFLAILASLSSAVGEDVNDTTSDALWMAAVAVLVASIAWHILRLSVAPSLRQVMVRLKHEAATENLHWPVPIGVLSLAMGTVRLALWLGPAVLALQLIFQIDADLFPIGMGLLGVWWFGSIVLWFLTMPARCPKGHTDLTWIYGEWRCRTCHRQRRLHHR
jgi:hypothetical protein